MRLELAVESDMDRILAISNWAAAHTTANFSYEPELLADWLAEWRQHAEMHPWLVARTDGGIVGFAKSAPYKSRAAYAWSASVSVYLDPSAHGRGLGTLLYTRLFEILTLQGYATLIAGITSGHTASERLHAKMGFTRCATYHRVGFKFEKWHDVGYWEKHLWTEDRAPEPIRPVSAVVP